MDQPDAVGTPAGQDLNQDTTSEDDTTEAPPDEADVDPVDFIPAAETIDWRDCGPLTQCGSVEVPADYNDPAAGTITIAVKVRRSDDLDARQGYLFVNPGGPGVPSLFLVDDAEAFFTDEIRESFDIIGFDPRGVGESEPTFACGAEDEQSDLLAMLDETPDTAEEIEIGSQAAQLCIDSMGPVGARLHSEFVARDMDKIREALGAEQISYLGFSYGSELGGWYASLFPDRVYSMAVDGAANPLRSADTAEEEIQLLRDSVGPLHDRLAAALASCDEDCPIWNDGDPEGYWYGMTDKFGQVSDATGGGATAILLSIVGHLYTEDTWPALHDSIFQLSENDDPSGFVAAIDRAGTVDGPSVTEHINCLDSWALFPDETLEDQVARAKEIEDQVDEVAAQEFPLLDAVDAPDEVGSCIFYGAIDPPVFEGVFDGGGIPILVVGNTSDPVTPFVQSEQYANSVLADGRLVMVEHGSHVVYPANACINDLVHSALIDQDYPTEEVTCEAESGLGKITLIPVDLAGGASSVHPDGWQELAPGFFARGQGLSDPWVAFQPSLGDVASTVAAFEAQVGGITAEPVGDVEINGVVWSLFAMEFPDEGLSVRFAISEPDTGAMIIGQAVSADIDSLQELVLQPAVEMFTA